MAQNLRRLQVTVLTFMEFGGKGKGRGVWTVCGFFEWLKEEGGGVEGWGVAEGGGEFWGGRKS